MLLAPAASTSNTKLALIACGVMAVLSWLGAWRAWQGPYRSERAGDPRDYYGDVRRRVMAAAITFSMGFAALLTNDLWGHHSAAAIVGILVFGIGFFVAGLAGFTIHALHRPRWAIPPDLRDKPRRSQRAQPGHP